MARSCQKEAQSRDYALLLFRMTSRVLYSAHYHRQHCTLQAFEQFAALYMAAQPRWQISGPTGIRTWYLQITSPMQSIRISYRGRPDTSVYTRYLGRRDKCYTNVLCLMGRRVFWRAWQILTHVGRPGIICKWGAVLNHVLTEASQQTRDVEPMLVQCWASVADYGPTLNQHCFIVSSLLWDRFFKGEYLFAEVILRLLSSRLQCWFEVGPASNTMAQHWINFNSIYRHCLEVLRVSICLQKLFYYFFHPGSPPMVTLVVARRC